MSVGGGEFRILLHHHHRIQPAESGGLGFQALSRRTPGHWISGFEHCVRLPAPQPNLTVLLAPQRIWQLGSWMWGMGTAKKPQLGSSRAESALLTAPPPASTLPGCSVSTSGSDLLVGPQSFFASAVIFLARGFTSQLQSYLCNSLMGKTRGVGSSPHLHHIT